VKGFKTQFGNSGNDRLSTALNNMTTPAEFTERYAGLLRYYGVEGEKIQAGQGHENGDWNNDIID
jgi:hypothetical protein